MADASLLDRFFTLIAYPGDTMPEHADVAIAIGIGTTKDGQNANTRSYGNAQHAYYLYRSKVTDALLLIGDAKTDRGLTEAQAMQKVVCSIAKQPVELSLAEGHTTLGNALAIREWMHTRDHRTAIVTAHIDHARRVAKVLRKQVPSCKFYVQSIRAAYSKDSGGRFISRPWFVAYNFAATVYYWLRGYI